MGKKLKAKILLVEDDDVLRKSLRYKLSSIGYSVIEATDGEKGLAAVKEGPDLILLDMYMPNVDGFQFLEQLARDPSHQKTPVIIITVSRHKSDVASSLSNVNIVGTLIKSDISLEEAAAKVALVLTPSIVHERKTKNG